MQKRMSTTPLLASAFSHIDTWIFDLDNTLYPADCNLFAQVDQRMGSFISNHLGIPFAQARHLQKAYYYQFGTTLAGLMKIHKIDPQAFLDYVHDIDLAAVPESPKLAALIDQLPGRKLIYTNGSHGHAERVAAKLGVRHTFDEICSIESSNFVPKPALKAYEAMARRHDVTPKSAAMFEDIPTNLEAPHAMGMATVLIISSYLDHPAQKAIRSWTTPPDHVHHVTDDLEKFLRQIAPTGAHSTAGLPAAQ